MKAIKEVITDPQKSDMGNGFGYVDGVTGCILEQILEFYAKNNKTWGTVCIYRHGNIIRKFDYDTYNNNIFNHNLNECVLQLTVKEVKFDYCYMLKNIDIYLN